MISVELTPDEAQTVLHFMKTALATVQPADQNHDGIVDAYKLLRDKIKAGKPVVAPAVSVKRAKTTK